VASESNSSTDEALRARSRRYGRLPPLNFFRPFDAAARHLSFTNAAEELHVTQSAVSQQIRQLEEFLDVRLFRRLTRRLELTREGMELAGAVAEALSVLGRACRRISDVSAPSVLCINAEPAYAMKWLIPRLQGFMQEYPHIKVTLLASSDPVDFERQDIDLAIRWGQNEWDGPHASRIFAEPIVAVCSPALLGPNRSTLTVGDLGKLTVLQVVNQPHLGAWLDSQNRGGLSCKGTLYFSDAMLMIEAAIQGQGFCFASPLLVESDLRSGRLVRLFAAELRTEEGYYLLCRADLADKPKIATFWEWLRRETKITMENIDERA
jgi:LysR family glycine cleavage system transcriptional activator